MMIRPAIMALALCFSACKGAVWACIDEARATEVLVERAKEVERYENARNVTITHYGGTPEPEHP